MILVVVKRPVDLNLVRMKKCLYVASELSGCILQAHERENARIVAAQPRAPRKQRAQPCGRSASGFPEWLSERIVTGGAISGVIAGWGWKSRARLRTANGEG